MSPRVFLSLVLGAAATALAISLCRADGTPSAFAENLNMNPCENFYTSTCESQYKNPDGSISNFKSLVAQAQDNVVAKLKAIMEDDTMNNIPSAKLARTFYSTCMDIEQIDAEGIKPIESVLRELRGWPITRRYAENESLANWQDLHAFYSKINVFPLFEISVNNDVLRRTHTILLRQPKTIIQEALLYKAKTFYQYVDYIKKVAVIVANITKSPVSEPEIAIGAKQIAVFEAEILKIMEMSDRVDFYRPVVLKKFQDITNQFVRDKNNAINWTNVINGVLFSKLVTDEDRVDVSTLSYFPRLMNLLHKTPLHIVVNYIHWRFVHQFLPYTSTELRNIFFNMRSFMQEPTKNLSRWRLCGFEPAFDNVFSYVFYIKYLTPEIEKSVQLVLNDIKQITVRAIRRSILLTEDEKKIAERKVLSMNFVLGIPDQLKNLSVIDNYYSKLSISDSYFDNILSLRRFTKMNEFEVIKKNDFRSTTNNNFMKITTISSIGSAYEFFENRVLIKAENLLAPIFEPHFPEYKKYGQLGFIIAYEMMHAFNDADSIGSTKSRKHLYSEETKMKFWEKMECFINQYDNYYIPDPSKPGKHVYVDGERSAVENMADSAAIQIAYQAFHERSKKQGFVCFEDHEDFFRSFATLLCRPELEEFYLSRFNLALRTLPRFRVIGSLSNTNEFAKSFACPSDARMNPESKCNFWN